MSLGGHSLSSQGELIPRRSPVTGVQGSPGEVGKFASKAPSILLPLGLPVFPRTGVWTPVPRLETRLQPKVSLARS